MDKETMGTVISVKKQWWLKINTKPVRMHALDGAIFPHIIKVQYTVDGKTYIKRKWIGANSQPPAEGSSVTVLYCGNNPNKANVLTDANYQKDAILRKDKQESENQTHYMPIGMCLGMSVGTALGAATDNLALYMCIGLSVGMCIGVLIDAKNRKASQKDEE
jgi:hypothetical protein